MDVLKYFTPIRLEEMDKVRLMDRAETKFVLNTSRVPKILDKAKEKYKILEIADKRQLRYHTTYYDTSNFAMYTDHHNGKLNRYKIRNRKYVETDDSFLEIKFKNNKGRTIKKRIEFDQNIPHFSAPDSQFIKSNSPYNTENLELKLENEFSRLTLVHKWNQERITIDMNLLYSNNDVMLEIPYLAIIEVKQAEFNPESEIMQILKSENLIPRGMSKYCIGSALMNKQLKYNKFKAKLLHLSKLARENDQSVFVN